MDYSEKWGTDVDTAVKLALDDLQLTIDEVDVTVLEEPSRGFFGIGSKLAKVRVEKKKPVKVEEKKQEAPADYETDMSAPAEFDVGSMKKTKITKEMSQTMATNRNIDDLMNQMEETFSQRLLRLSFPR